MMDRWPELIPLFILIFAIWSSLRSRRKRRQRQQEQRRREGADWAFTREGQIAHLNKRREEEGG